MVRGVLVLPSSRETDFFEDSRLLLYHELLTTWTPKVCRIIALCYCWAIILPTFGGLGSCFSLHYQENVPQLLQYPQKGSQNGESFSVAVPASHLQ